jgi:hypothetical protein
MPTNRPYRPPACTWPDSAYLRPSSVANSGSLGRQGPPPRSSQPIPSWACLWYVPKTSCSNVECPSSNFGYLSRRAGETSAAASATARPCRSTQHSHTPALCLLCAALYSLSEQPEHLHYAGRTTSGRHGWRPIAVSFLRRASCQCDGTHPSAPTDVNATARDSVAPSAAADAPATGLPTDAARPNATPADDHTVTEQSTTTTV